MKINYTRRISCAVVMVACISLMTGCTSFVDTILPIIDARLPPDLRTGIHKYREYIAPMVDQWYVMNQQQRAAALARAQNYNGNSQRIAVKVPSADGDKSWKNRRTTYAIVDTKTRKPVTNKVFVTEKPLPKAALAKVGGYNDVEIF